MMNLTWTPVGKMPKSSDTQGEYYTPGVSVTGLPYSNTSGTFGYMGRDVSFYTFMSAVNNPKSKMYTVDYRTSTSWNSKSSFYGAACSSMVAYAWGIPATYLTNSVYAGLTAGIIDKKQSQDVQDLNLFDIYCWAASATSGGHMAMVYDIARDNTGKIQEVTIFESVHPLSRTMTSTPATLKKTMEEFKSPAFFYEYNHNKYYNELSIPAYWEQSNADLATNFPTSLCVDLGDKVSVKQGTAVTINILASDYANIELYSGDNLYESRALNSTDDVTFVSLPAGLYKARLAKGSSYSEYTYFEIGSTSCGVSSKNDFLTISCANNTSDPAYIILEDRKSVV